MLPSFQDGGLEGGCGHSSPFRLHVQNRPQGRILCCPHPPGTPKASLLSIQKCNLPVQMPTFRSHFSTSGLHKSAEAPGGLDDMLILNSQREGAIRDASLMIYLLESLGFVVNTDKSILLPSQEMEFLGVLVNSITMSLSLPDNKVLNLQKECRSLLSSRSASQSDLAHLIGKMVAAKAAVFQAPLHYRALQHLKNSLDHQGVPLHQKVILDIEVRLDLDWWITNLPTANFRPVKPFLPNMLIQSDASGWDRDKGNLVSSRILTLHKLPGAAGSHLCNQGLHQIPEQCPCPNTNGQHISYSLCKQNGGSQEECVRQTCSFPLGVVPREEDHSSSGAHPRSTECCGRCRVSSKTRCSGLEARFKSVQGSESQFRSLYDRPFCQQEQHSVGEILQLSARSPSGTVRCPSSTLEGRECLRLPPFQLDQRMPEEDKPRRSSSVDHMPSVASPGVVPPPSADAHRQSSFASVPQRSVVKPNGGQTSNDHQQLPATSRMESLRDHLSSEGISREATDILLSAQRRSTNAQYKSCWAKWCSWSHQRQIDPFRPAVSDLVHFLTELFEQGKQYSTINTYRSAISSTVPPLEGTPLGQHKIVCNFMRGVFNRRPPKPRYSATWEVSLVTDLFEKWPDNSILDIKRLSRKCAMLLALTSAKRQSDLHALDLAFMQYLPEGVEFRIPGLTKTRVPGKDVTFFFPALKGNVQLCPVACLKEYFKKTEIHRSHSGISQPLLLATQRPFSPISSTSIGRWLKLTLKDVGIDTSVFKAHSTRGASSSAARQGGVSWQQRTGPERQLSIALLPSTPLCFLWHSSHFIGQLL